MTRYNIYLSSPIDQETNPQKYEKQKQQLTTELKKNPNIDWVYNPGAAFDIGHHAQINPGIRQINLHALDQSNLLIAWMPQGAISVGVPMEIQHAIDTNKTTWVISDAPAWMLNHPNINQTQNPTDIIKWLENPTPNPQQPPTENHAHPMYIKVEPGAEKPRKGYPGDAGYDLVVSQNTTINPNQYADVPCGVSIALPEWTWGLITGRSSTLRSRGLLVTQGVIDMGYTGPLFAGVYNTTPNPVHVKKGDRLAQFIVIDNTTRLTQLEQVDQLPERERGNAGFGSTGM